MKVFFASTLAVGIALSQLGCSTANKIVGTWEAEIQGTRVTQTMNPNNTYVASVQFPLPTGGNATIKVDGTYKLEGDQLTTTATNIGVEGADKSLADMLKKNAEAGLKKAVTAPITWKNNDEFVTASAAGGAQVTFKRKK